MHRILVAVAGIMILASVVASAQQPQSGVIKTFKGTWTCLACDLKGLDGSVRAQCEDLGHKHCLRLDNGNYVFFLENDHSLDLIKGGGRHNTRMSVTGKYFPKAHVLDVQSYVIDDITTAWCPVHQKMDMCSDAKHASQEDAGGENKGDIK
jgi:hypothetical protein